MSPPAHPLPLQRPAPLRAISFTRTRPQCSQLPIPPKAVCMGLHFLQLSATSPGHTFAPLSATGQGLGQEGRTPEKYICFNKCAGMHLGTRTFTPEPRAPPQLRQNFYKGTCLSGTWSMFVLLTLTTPRSFYFAEYKSLTAEVKKPNKWNGSWLAPFLGCHSLCNLPPKMPNSFWGT